jgi:uncharacterized membrane protein HdeD (DUF308 family)
MATLLKRAWWALLLQGLAGVLFGVVALIWPGLTLATLVLLFGAYALVGGVFGVVGSVVHRKEHEDWWLVLLTGLVSIAVGILTFIQPGITALSLLFLIAAWALVIGVLTIVIAIQLRKEIEGEWLLILAGIASVLFGLFVFALPGAGALSLIWLIATYAIIFGVLQVGLAFRARSWAKDIARRRQAVA